MEMRQQAFIRDGLRPPTPPSASSATRLSYANRAAASGAGAASKPSPRTSARASADCCGFILLAILTLALGIGADAAAQPRFLTLLLAIFAAAALLLAAVRIYAVMSWPSRGARTKSASGYRSPLHAQTFCGRDGAGGLGSQSRRSALFVAADVLHALRSQAGRSADVRDGYRGAGAGCAPFDPRSSAPGDAHRSDGRATAGMID